LTDPQAEALTPQQWYDLIVEASADGSWYWDINADAIHCSPRLLDILGADTRENPLTSQQFVSYLHPDDRRQHTSAMERCLKGESAEFQTETRVVKRSGRVCWILNRGLARRDGSGRAYCMFGSVVDITPRRRLEDSLRAVALSTTEGVGAGFFESLVRYLSEALDCDIAIIGKVDANGGDRIKTLAVHKDGKPAPNFHYELPGTPCDTALTGRTRAYPASVIELFPDDELLREEGVEAYIGSRLLDSSNQPIGLIVALYRQPVSDVATVEDLLKIFASRAGAELERQDKVRALEDSEQRFRDFTEVSSDWFWEMDSELRFVFMSEGVERATGAPSDYFLGQTRREVLSRTTDPEVERHFQDLEAHRPFRDFVYPAETPRGRRYFSVSGKPMFDANGTFLGYRGTGSDVTDAHHARVLMRRRGTVLEMIARDAPLDEVLQEIIGIAEMQLEPLTGAIFHLQEGCLQELTASRLPDTCI